jgi:polysaccharide chain length determinant protein (PEP-CTERM system associated)
VATPEIDARIEAQRRNLDGLLQRFTEQHPDVTSTRRLIAELEAQKRKEVQDAQRRLAAAGPGVSAMPTETLAQQELNRLLANAEVQVASMQARVDEFSRRMAVAREQLKTAPQIEAEAAQLNRDYAVIRRSYEELVARRQSAVMSGELEVASGVTEFRLIDPPRVPSKPVSPNRILLLAAVLAGSIGAGLGIAFLSAQLRPTFGDASELRQATGLPLLGVVSGLRTEADRRSARASALSFASASGSLLLLGAVGLVFAAMMNR